MQQYRIVQSLVHALIAAILGLAFQYADQLRQWIDQSGGLAGPALFAGLVTGLTLLFRVSDSLSGIVLQRIPFVSRALRKSLSGKEFIEGDWPLVVIDMQDGANIKPLYVGFLSIGFKGGQPYVSGDDWNMDGTPAHAFESVQSLYGDGLLQYWYRQGKTLRNAEMRGYTEIYFFPENAFAERHAGKFLDPKHTSDIRFYAERVRYKPFARKISRDQDKIAAARELWNRLEPKTVALRALSIETDFK